MGDSTHLLLKFINCHSGYLVNGSFIVSKRVLQPNYPENPNKLLFYIYDFLDLFFVSLKPLDFLFC